MADYTASLLRAVGRVLICHKDFLAHIERPGNHRSHPAGAQIAREAAIRNGARAAHFDRDLREPSLFTPPLDAGARRQRVPQGR
jgi:hypothetical protein